MELIDRLNKEKRLSSSEWKKLLSSWIEEDRTYAAFIARTVVLQKFGKSIYIRGVIEFSNFCKNDCYYCGIRHSNSKIGRYRLSKEDILNCCQKGHSQGFRTFVLQSGEDPYFTTDKLADIVSEIKNKYPDSAVTLSVGELKPEDYTNLFKAGTDRYLLRHETADEKHYKALHPAKQSWKNRMRCLQDLKDTGYQTGCGFIVGAPYQNIDCMVKDMEFLSNFNPEMIGIGPFIPHKDTPFAAEKTGSLETSLFFLSLCRIMLPDVLLPATTALGTIDPEGREKGILAGANVIMPNLSPSRVRGKYMLYNNKQNSDVETSRCMIDLRKRMSSIGYDIKISRGDYKGRNNS
ncbi:MAG: [FeFe] hydrogenase H-cluster radical SAM maturase HydE [Spirochaetales bacterium]|nr:[FeFe] hydrogenase H-cluster radical SAM maturase HydE [Spirochaetales bacterium]